MEIVDLGSKIISDFSRLNKEDQDLVVRLLKGSVDSGLFGKINSSERREDIFSLAKYISEQKEPYEMVKKLIISYEDKIKNERSLSFSDFFYKVRSILQSQIKEVLSVVEKRDDKDLLIQSIMLALTSNEDYYSDDVLDNAKLMTLVKKIKDSGYARLLNDSVFVDNYKDIVKLKLETENTLDKLFNDEKINFDQKFSLNKFIESGGDVLKISSQETGKAVGITFSERHMEGLNEFSRESIVCRVISDARMEEVMGCGLNSWEFYS